MALTILILSGYGMLLNKKTAFISLWSMPQKEIYLTSSPKTMDSHKFKLSDSFYKLLTP